jgi:nuclear transport factor 2 (NTF2) superfamily protein
MQNRSVTGDDFFADKDVCSIVLEVSNRDRCAESPVAEDAWNSRDPAKVALAYTVDSRWRMREA